MPGLLGFQGQGHQPWFPREPGACSRRRPQIPFQTRLSRAGGSARSPSRGCFCGALLLARGPAVGPRGGGGTELWEKRALTPLPCKGNLTPTPQSGSRQEEGLWREERAATNFPGFQRGDTVAAARSCRPLPPWFPGSRGRRGLGPGAGDREWDMPTGPAGHQAQPQNRTGPGSCPPEGIHLTFSVQEPQGGGRGL